MLDKKGKIPNNCNVIGVFYQKLAKKIKCRILQNWMETEAEKPSWLEVGKIVWSFCRNAIIFNHLSCLQYITNLRSLTLPV